MLRMTGDKRTESNTSFFCYTILYRFAHVYSSAGDLDSRVQCTVCNVHTQYDVLNMYKAKRKISINKNVSMSKNGETVRMTAS